MCGIPGRSLKGIVSSLHSTGNYSPGHRAEYSCQRGFIQLGNATRICQHDGLWSGTWPRCGEFPFCLIVTFNNNEIKHNGIRYPTLKLICFASICSSCYHTDSNFISDNSRNQPIICSNSVPSFYVISYFYLKPVYWYCYKFEWGSIEMNPMMCEGPYS